MRDIIDFIIDKLHWIIVLLLLWNFVLPIFFGQCTNLGALNYNKDAWFTNNDECEYRPRTPEEIRALQRFFFDNSDDIDIDCDWYDYWDDCIDAGCHWEAFDEYSGLCTDGY